MIILHFNYSDSRMVDAMKVLLKMSDDIGSRANSKFSRAKLISISHLVLILQFAFAILQLTWHERRSSAVLLMQLVLRIRHVCLASCIVAADADAAVVVAVVIGVGRLFALLFV